MNNQNYDIVNFNTLVIYVSWLMAELQAQTPCQANGVYKSYHC